MLLVPAVLSDEECRSEDSHSSGARSDTMTPPPRGQYKCAVARMFEAIQVMHAAGRQEVLQTETVKIEGSDWVNLPGLGNDFTNPNWNWFNSQNPTTIMDVINQDRSEKRGAWKFKVGNYFVSKCPAARSFLAWAQKFDGEDTFEATRHEIATMPGTAVSPPLVDSLNVQI